MAKDKLTIEKKDAEIKDVRGQLEEHKDMLNKSLTISDTLT